ncbi:hypothetical protein ABC270_16555 [Curtobacterium sp. 1P10AnD]|uniref:hypothetical protein n=1 Tax=Curtobacterium sp. 1P10AnD TaxID=3132283 RepID=UPI00399F6709
MKFRDGMAGDPLAAAIELLWTGHAQSALEHLERLPESLRVRALIADCKRDLGDHLSAVQEYDRLVAECAGTAREAVMRQHRAKALLAAGRADRAIEDFRRVVELRREHDSTLLASAEQGLAAARSAELRQSMT